MSDSFAPDNSGVDLSDFDDDFSSAEAPSFDEVPDGKYQARIETVRLDRSQKGDPMIRWDLVVIAGQHAQTAGVGVQVGAQANLGAEVSHHTVHRVQQRSAPLDSHRCLPLD